MKNPTSQPANIFGPEQRALWGQMSVSGSVWAEKDASISPLNGRFFGARCWGPNKIQNKERRSNKCWFGIWAIDSKAPHIAPAAQSLFLFVNKTNSEADFCICQKTCFLDGFWCLIPWQNQSHATCSSQPWSTANNLSFIEAMEVIESMVSLECIIENTNL